MSAIPDRITRSISPSAPRSKRPAQRGRVGEQGPPAVAAAWRGRAVGSSDRGRGRGRREACKVLRSMITKISLLFPHRPQHLSRGMSLRCRRASCPGSSSSKTSEAARRCTWPSSTVRAWTSDAGAWQRRGWGESDPMTMRTRRPRGLRRDAAGRGRQRLRALRR